MNSGFEYLDIILLAMIAGFIILRLRNIFEKALLKNKIEFRRGNAGGGNQIRQPYLKKYVKKLNVKKFKEIEHIHFYGYYIGNYPTLTKNKIRKICKILNGIKT